VQRGLPACLRENLLSGFGCLAALLPCIPAFLSFDASGFATGVVAVLCIVLDQFGLAFFTQITRMASGVIAGVSALARTLWSPHMHLNLAVFLAGLLVAVKGVSDWASKKMEEFLSDVSVDTELTADDSAAIVGLSGLSAHALEDFVRRRLNQDMKLQLINGLKELTRVQAWHGIRSMEDIARELSSASLSDLAAQFEDIVRRTIEQLHVGLPDGVIGLSAGSGPPGTGVLTGAEKALESMLKLGQPWLDTCKQILDVLVAKVDELRSASEEAKKWINPDIAQVLTWSSCLAERLMAKAVHEISKAHFLEGSAEGDLSSRVDTLKTQLEKYDARLGKFSYAVLHLLRVNTDLASRYSEAEVKQRNHLQAIHEKVAALEATIEDEALQGQERKLALSGAASEVVEAARGALGFAEKVEALREFVPAIDSAAEGTAVAALEGMGLTGEAEFVDNFVKARMAANRVVGVTRSCCEAMSDLTDELGSAIANLQAFADLGSEMLAPIQELLLVTAGAGAVSEAEDLSEAWASLRARCCSFVRLGSGSVGDSIEALRGLASEQTLSLLDELLSQLRAPLEDLLGEAPEEEDPLGAEDDEASEEDKAPRADDDSGEIIIQVGEETQVLVSL